jgi:hypothetical protein
MPTDTSLHRRALKTTLPAFESLYPRGSSACSRKTSLRVKASSRCRGCSKYSTRRITRSKRSHCSGMKSLLARYRFDGETASALPSRTATAMSVSLLAGQPLRADSQPIAQPKARSIAWEREACLRACSSGCAACARVRTPCAPAPAGSPQPPSWSSSRDLRGVPDDGHPRCRAAGIPPPSTAPPRAPSKSR